jgi:uncharacterized membrane protein
MKAALTAGNGWSELVRRLFSQPRNLLLLALWLLDILFLITLLLFALRGLLQKMDWRIKVMLLGVSAYVLVVCSQPVGYGAYPRFRLSISMMLLLFAAFGLDSFFEKRGRIYQRIHN